MTKMLTTTVFGVAGLEARVPRVAFLFSNPFAFGPIRSLGSLAYRKAYSKNETEGVLSKFPHVSKVSEFFSANLSHFVHVSWP